MKISAIWLKIYIQPFVVLMKLFTREPSVVQCTYGMPCMEEKAGNITTSLPHGGSLYHLPGLVPQKAKKKPMEKVNPSDLGVDISPRLEVLKVEDPPVRQAGSKVENVDELISKLKEAGVV